MNEIKLHRTAPIRINCPSGTERKYPAFYRAFHGRRGKVLEVEPHGAQGVVHVDLSTPAEAGVWINVERSWLSHDRGAKA